MSVGLAGAQALARALQGGHLQHLHTLDLSQNDLGDEGASALAGALKSGEPLLLHKAGGRCKL